jgi:hypothetical protein
MASAGSMRTDAPYRYILSFKKLNSVAVVRKRTTPTKPAPLVGEVSANLYG